MSIVVSEKIGSRTVQRSALSSPTGVREFIVFDGEPTTDNALTAMVALRAEGVPQVGDSHPEDRQMTVIGHEITADPASNFAQFITCNYAVSGLGGGGSYTAVSTNVRSIARDIYRNFPTMPPYDSFGVSIEDIGGYSVDLEGKPVSVGIFQQTLDVRSPYANKPDFNTIRSFTNCRNIVNWEGFPAGQLLYLGASASVSNGNVWTTTHKFAADEMFHAKQVAMRDSDNKVVTEWTNSTPFQRYASDVRWAQPFPQLRNFEDLHLGTLP